VVYYTAPDSDRVDVDERFVEFSMEEPGEHLFPFSSDVD
jgi:hypothetical protein